MCVSEMTQSQNSLGDHWQQATTIMLVIFVLAELYAIWRYNIEKGYNWYHLPLQVTNKAVCSTALNGFAIVQLPGPLAKFWKKFLDRGSFIKSLPSWLVSALEIRKHVGLVSLFFLWVHIFMSLVLFNPAYYGKFFDDPTALPTKLNVIGETSFFFGILGFMLYQVVGLSSLPSIGQSMNKVQSIFGPVVWCALVFGTIHVLIMGIQNNGWTSVGKWPGGLPPITLTSTLVPMFVILVKVIQV
ncbi:unnamed protein product, partial [Heterosigma akashiwo]